MASSWAEALKEYEATKKAPLTIPSENAVPRRAYRDHRFSKFDEHHEFNPVLGKYTDPQKDVAKRSEAENARLRAEQKVKARTQRLEQPWDVINHAAKTPNAEEELAAERRREERLRQDAERARAAAQREAERAARRGLGLSRAERDARDFDIVSNKLTHGDHEQWLARQAADTLRTAAERFWHVNRFDPIRGVYTSPDEEHLQRRVAQEKAEQTARRKLGSLPPRIRLSEGMTYDITSGAARDPERLRAVEDRQAAARARMAVKYTQELRARDRGAEEAERSLERKTNRIREERFVRHLERGYDIVSGAALDPAGAPAASASPLASSDVLSLSSAPAAALSSPLSRAPPAPSSLGPGRQLLAPVPRLPPPFATGNTFTLDHEAVSTRSRKLSRSQPLRAAASPAPPSSADGSSAPASAAASVRPPSTARTPPARLGTASERPPVLVQPGAAQKKVKVVRVTFGPPAPPAAATASAAAPVSLASSIMKPPMPASAPLPPAPSQLSVPIPVL